MHVVTNAHKAPAFVEWAQGREVTVHDDGTSTNEDRLGAIGDMQFVIERAGIDDDLLVIAGDNLFEFDLSEFVALLAVEGQQRAQSPCGTSARASSRSATASSTSPRTGACSTSSRSRRTRRRRSPRPPRTSTTVRTSRSSARISTTGIHPTSPAGSSRWLYQREPVYGWAFDEGWYDIGDHEQLLEADNRFASRAGPARARGLQPRLVTHLAQRRDGHVTPAPVALVAWLVDLLLPPRCVSCGGPSRTLCSGCRARLRPLRPPRCARCGAPTAWPVERCRECAGRRRAFASARSAVEYAGPAQALVRAWKERGLRHLAACAAELVVEHVERPAVDLITYVPSDPIRQLGRGRHPAEALARELAGRWELELVLGARARACSRAAGDASVRASGG